MDPQGLPVCSSLTGELIKRTVKNISSFLRRCRSDVVQGEKSGAPSLQTGTGMLARRRATARQSHTVTLAHSWAPLRKESSGQDDSTARPWGWPTSVL